MPTTMDRTVAQGLAQLLREVEDAHQDVEQELWSRYYAKGLELFAHDGTEAEIQRASDFATAALEKFRSKFPRGRSAELADALDLEARIDAQHSESFARAEQEHDRAIGTNGNNGIHVPGVHP